MHIIACINYQDQGVFMLLEDKSVWRVWHDGLGLLIENSISRDIPYSVTTYFKSIWPEY